VLGRLAGLAPMPSEAVVIVVDGRLTAVSIGLGIALIPGIAVMVGGFLVGRPRQRCGVTT
jgi:hypothetical protein